MVDDGAAVDERAAEITLEKAGGPSPSDQVQLGGEVGEPEPVQVLDPEGLIQPQVVPDPIDVFLLDVGIDLEPGHDVPRGDPDQEVADNCGPEERGDGGEHPAEDVFDQHCATLYRSAAASFPVRHLPSDTKTSFMKTRRPVCPMNVPYCQFCTR